MWKISLQKLINYEFWPFWIFYGMLTPFYLYYVLKTKAPAYFCNVNPLMRFGGFYGYSKFDLLEKIEPHWIPKTTLVHQKNVLDFEPNSYPFVAKPDVGERGKQVAVIRNREEWSCYRGGIKTDVIIQDFVDFPLEFGLFYVRYPKEEKGKIIAITAKEFLTVKGDGKATLAQLIARDLRASQQRKFLKKRFANHLDEVLKQNEELLLSEIGNHYRGTKFLDASHLHSGRLENCVDEAVKNIPHFYYGRLDVKAQSIEDLQNGNFVILEINGANSEATQLYDPKYSVFEAWSIARQQLAVQYRVAKQNKENGFDYPPAKPLAKALFRC